jgi:hypothetical protein
MLVLNQSHAFKSLSVLSVLHTEAFGYLCFLAPETRYHTLRGWHGQLIWFGRAGAASLRAVFGGRATLVFSHLIPEGMCLLLVLSLAIHIPSTVVLCC